MLKTLKLHIKTNRSIWNFIFILLCTSPSSFINGQTLSREALEKKIENIEDDLLDNKFDTAIQKIDTLLENHKIAYLYKLKGDAITHFNDRFIIDSLVYRKAMDCYNAAIKMEPNYYKALYGRSYLNYTHQLFPEAINDASVAFKVAKNKEEAIDILNFRALIFTRLQDIENAIQDYKDVLELDPEYDMAYSNLSMLFANKGEHEKAKELQLKSIELNPTEIRYYNNLSLTYIELGKFNEADSLMTICIEESESPDPFFYNNRGYARIKLGKLKIAEQDIKRSITLHPDNSYAYRNLALLYIEKNQKEAICKNLEKAIELNFTVIYGDEVEKLLQKHCE